MVSKMKKVLLSLTHCLLNTMTNSSESPVTPIYHPFCIQNGVVPSSTSRSVPPPIAVTSPTT